jgi:hypothetical protein
MHLDVELVERLLHGELSRGAERDARDHVAECGECRARLIAAERDQMEIFALLCQVDHPLSSVDPERFAASLRRKTGWGRWAAGILLFLGVAGTAYAIPGSPLRDWVRTAAMWVAGSEEPTKTPTQAQASDPGAAGIAAIPGRDFVIVFESPEAGGTAEVSLTDAPEVTVRAPSGAARYTSGPNRLVITNRGSGARYEIQIPRSAPRLEILVAGRRIFLKDGPRVVTGRSEKVEGGYTLPLSP